MLKRLRFIFILALVVAITGCGDDSTGPGEEEPPPLPEMQNAQPDLSFFEATAPTNNDTAYAQAQAQMMGANIMLSLGQVYGGFMESARGEDASFDDGTWNWNYNDNYQGINLEIEVTAQEQDNSTEWAMFWTFDDGEDSYEDYRVMEGTVRNDGSEGDWTFNTFDENDQETPAFTSSWQIISDSEETITMEMYDGETNPVTLIYRKNDSEFEMEYDFPDEEEDVLIIWNTDTGTGELRQGDMRQCWDENLQDTSCD